jgi:hypothetical protein
MDEKIYTEAEMRERAAAIIRMYVANYDKGLIVGAIIGTVTACAALGAIAAGREIGKAKAEEARKKKSEKKSEIET